MTISACWRYCYCNVCIYITCILNILYSCIVISFACNKRNILEFYAIALRINFAYCLVWALKLFSTTFVCCNKFTMPTLKDVLKTFLFNKQYLRALLKEFDIDICSIDVRVSKDFSKRRYKQLRLYFRKLFRIVSVKYKSNFYLNLH